MEDVRANLTIIYNLIQAHIVNRANSVKPHNPKIKNMREIYDLNSYCYYNLVENYTYIINNPDKQSPDVHREFIKRIQNEGWTYGEHRDLKNKFEPWCVPYSELSTQQTMIWSVGYINVKFMTTPKSAEAKN